MRFIDKIKNIPKTPKFWPDVSIFRTNRQHMKKLR